MELQDVSVTAKDIQAGFQAVTVTAGQSFKIEISPGGEEILDVTVPGGKEWSVQINVQIIETDA